MPPDRPRLARAWPDDLLRSAQLFADRGGRRAGIGAAIAVAIIEGQTRRANRATCLAIRGWGEVRLTPAEVATLAKLSPTERDVQMARAIADTAPTMGTVVRQWHNDYAELPAAGAAR